LSVELHVFENDIATTSEAMQRWLNSSEAKEALSKYRWHLHISRVNR